MFDIQSPFSPSGDQQQAIDALIRGIEFGISKALTIE
jgi:excinuclease UvrABC helicase subunit UvrB